MMQIVRNRRVELRLPTLLCDKKLNACLDTFPLTSLMNKSFAVSVIGKSGSGKTSLLVGLLNTKGLFKRVFDTIILFMPPNSRASVKDSIFGVLPENQVFDDLNLANLEKAYEIAKRNRTENRTTLIIFDDVQQHFKGDCETLLLAMMVNRRHNMLSLVFVAQTYKKIPRSCRLGMTDLFCFNLSKGDMSTVHDELLHCEQSTYNKLYTLYRTQLKEAPRLFWFINVETQRMFFNWDEILYDIN